MLVATKVSLSGSLRWGRWLPVPWSTILGLLRRGGPALLKLLPKLWPLLLESKNRQALVSAAKDLASLSPEKRLRGQAEGTHAVAKELASDASEPADRARAEDWAGGARDLIHQLKMPATGREARTRRRSSVRTQLDELQAEMQQHLSRRGPRED